MRDVQTAELAVKLPHCRKQLLGVSANVISAKFHCLHIIRAVGDVTVVLAVEDTVRCHLLLLYRLLHRANLARNWVLDLPHHILPHPLF